MTTIVLIGLPAGTLTWNWADCGAPAEDDELVLTLRPVPIGGGLVPGLGTNAAAGRKLVAATPGWTAVHFGISTNRVPSPCRNCTTTEPGVLIATVGFDEAVFVPVPHGGTTTVRAASAVGTITARVQGLTALTLLGPLATMPATTRTMINTTIVTHMDRLAPRLGTSCPRRRDFVASAIGMPP